MALREALPELKVELVHGRQPAAQKEATMAAFKANRVQLLVATTVIEVGVDVPNATLMVIENAERMGLAQLHQLRGRVGRGAAASMCVLLYRAPLSTAGAGAAAYHPRDHATALRSRAAIWSCADRASCSAPVRRASRSCGSRTWRGIRICCPLVQKTAELMLRDYPDNITPLTTRWIGEGERYGTVG